MRKIQNIIFTFVLLVLGNAVYPATITLVNHNGDWSANSTWDLNRVPKNGDIVNIPLNKTVKVSSNVYNVVPQQPILFINIYGVLLLTETGQLNLDCQSSVCVFNTGQIPATGCNCNQISMGVGEAAWKGASSGTIFGGSCVPSPCTSLPVSIIGFDASAKNESVELSWTAAQELSLAYYEIERSADGISFDAIDRVNALNKTTNTAYSFTDLNPLEGISYYRLMTVDLDNSISFSAVVKTNSSQLTSIEVFPNPSASGNFSILVPGSAGQIPVKLIIRDMMGNELASEYSLDGKVLRVSASSFMPGVYGLTVYCGDAIFTSRLVIQ